MLIITNNNNHDNTLNDNVLDADVTPITTMSYVNIGCTHELWTILWQRCSCPLGHRNENYMETFRHVHVCNSYHLGFQSLPPTALRIQCSKWRLKQKSEVCSVRSEVCDNCAKISNGVCKGIALRNTAHKCISCLKGLHL